MSFWFGEFELDQERRQLLRGGVPVPLEPKAYELLSVLLERRPRALSRAQIRDAIWAGTYVSESTLGVAVNAIRQALGDEARQPRFVRTVHGFGYAFCGEAREWPNGRPEAGQAPLQKGGEASDPASQEVKSIEGTAAARKAAAPAGRWRVAMIGAGLVVLSLAGSFAVRRKGPSGTAAAVVEPRPVPLTSFPGVELNPALSPDGTRVAFIWNGPNRDNADVYVKDIGSGEVVRVTQDPAPDYRPAWSPDGKHLAFLRGQPTRAAVFVAPTSAGRERRLTDIAQPLSCFDGSWVHWVHWSPDGRFLAVADRVSEGAKWGIVLVSVETGEKRTLTANAEEFRADLYPTFSPDGGRLAFLRGRPFVPDAWDVVVQPLSGGSRPQPRGDAVVVRGAALDGFGAITWLPSGKELLAGGQRISLDGSPSRPFGHPGRKPTDRLDVPMMDPVSIRGARLAFETPEFRSQLVDVPLAGAGKGLLAPFFSSTRGEWDPAFAPDGRRVAFASWRSGDAHIWVGEADGSACRELPLPPGDRYAGSPSWSPDGRRLAFDAGSGVYIATPDVGTLRRLTSERTPGARPRWSRDGRLIYFASTRGGGDWQLWKAPADADGEDDGAVQITRAGGMEAEESLDGRYVYYAKRGAAGVFRLPVDSPAAPEERVLDTSGEGLWHLVARGILSLDLQSRRPTIRLHDFIAGTTSVVLEFPPAPGWDFVTFRGGFTVSPDERRALIGTSQLVESDIMLLDGFR